MSYSRLPTEEGLFTTRPLSGNGAYFITAQPGVSATLALQFMLQEIEQYATFSALLS